MPVIFEGILWLDEPEFEMNKASISGFAQPSSGVFVVYSVSFWLYFEPATNIHEQLFHIVKGGYPVPLLYYDLTGFTTRTMDYDLAVRFAAKLTSHYDPVFHPLPADNRPR